MQRLNSDMSCLIPCTPQQVKDEDMNVDGIQMIAFGPGHIRKMSGLPSN